MKYLLPTIVSVPTALVVASAFFRVLTGWSLFEVIGIPPIFGLLSLLSFATCVALIFVFPRSKEWKVAAILNGIPLLLVLLIMLLFALVGYNG